MWAAPCSVATVLMHFLFRVPGFEVSGIGSAGGTLLSGFSFILGFLVVFRSQQAYARWWEGGSLLQKISGEWLNAFSSLLVFCDKSGDKAYEVEKFQHQMVR